jgi:hypothetical protein
LLYFHVINVVALIYIAMFISFSLCRQRHISPKPLCFDIEVQGNWTISVLRN